MICLCALQNSHGTSPQYSSNQAQMRIWPFAGTSSLLRPELFSDSTQSSIRIVLGSSTQIPESYVRFPCHTDNWLPNSERLLRQSCVVPWYRHLILRHAHHIGHRILLVSYRAMARRKSLRSSSVQPARSFQIATRVIYTDRSSIRKPCFLQMRVAKALPSCKISVRTCSVPSTLHGPLRHTLLQ